jgi:NitT/TauT family transport system substrate-binding protein
MKRGLLLCSAILFAACSRAPVESSRVPVRLAVGGQAQMIYWPVTVAETLGYYKDEGLDVSIQDFPGGSKALESLFGGTADVVCGFYDHTVQMAAQGRELRAFVSMLRYPGLVAAGISPTVSRVEDLKGKAVGVSASGSSTHMFLNYLLAQHGLKPEDVSVVQVGLGATAVAAAVKTRVDAEILTDPTVGLLQKQVSSLRILADTREAPGVRGAFGVDTYPASVLYSTGDWLNSHHSVALRLARAIAKTLAWMRSHSAEEIRAKMPATLRIQDEQVELEGVRSLKNMLSEDGRFNAASAEVVRHVLGQSIDGVRKAQVDLSKTYTNAFMEEASRPE